ncbi:MAG: E3 binding domain-containing protein, partial [Firmicutes bacterium]|nr:E3 binding domain-containing protein [Bacillota bacterium]
MQWHVKEGDEVAQFDLLCSVQSDKATVEITSRYDGIIKKLNWQEGEMAKVGSTLVEVETDSGPESETQSNTVEFNNEVDSVEKNKIINKEEIDKQVRFAKGQKSYSMDPVLVPIRRDSGEVSSSTAAEVQHSASRPMTSVDNAENDVTSDKILTTPAVRRLAKEHHIDLKEIRGTGSKGRVLKEDVLNYIAQGKPVTKSASIASPMQQHEPGTDKAEGIATPSVEGTSRLRVDEEINIRGIQKMMHQSMTHSLQIPH